MRGVRLFRFGMLSVFCLGIENSKLSAVDLDLLPAGWPFFTMPGGACPSHPDNLHYNSCAIGFEGTVYFANFL